MASVAALTLGRSHLVFVDPDFIPHTFPTNAACDRLHHRLVAGRLSALASRATLHNRQDSNLDYSVGIKSGVSLLSISMVSLALRAGVGLLSY